jgi:hypothetical protein
MNQYTNDELQLLAEMYDLSVEELQELFEQGYTEEDLDRMYSPEEEEEDESSMEEEQYTEEDEEEPVMEARMGLSLADLVTKSLQDYTKSFNVGGQTNNIQCPPGQVYDPVAGMCVTDTKSGVPVAKPTSVTNPNFGTPPQTPDLRDRSTIVLPSEDISLHDIGMSIPEANPEDPSAQEIEDALGPSTSGTIDQQNRRIQEERSNAGELITDIQATDPYRNKDMQAFTDIGDKTRDELKLERIEGKVREGLKKGLTQGAKFLGSPTGQGMMMGLGNMAVDALSANAMNQQLAGLKQARVFNINPDFFSGANPGIASSNNYDMSAAIYADAGAAVQTQNLSSRGDVPIEAEGGEFYFDPNSMATIPISGPKHEQGGVPFNAEDGAFIFSDSQKISGKMVNEMIGTNKLKDKKQYTISDVIRTLPDFFDTKKEAEELTKTTNDKIRTTSLNRNIEKKANNLAMLLAYQQKKNGNHGEEVEQEQMNNEVPMADPGMAVTSDPTRVGAIDRLVTNGTISKKQADILKQNVTINSDGSLVIKYDPELSGIDKDALSTLTSKQKNKNINFTGIPANVKTFLGEDVSLIKGSEKREFYDKVSKKTFGSKEEYEKFKTENPDVYKDYGKSLENYTTMEQYTPTKLGNDEAVAVLKKYKSPSASLDKYVLDKNKLLGEDGKVDPRKVDELSTAFNSLEGGAVGKDGKRRFRYTDEKGKTHDIWQLSTPGFKKGTFFAGIDPEIASAYYVYKTYGEDVYNQNKDKPNALKNIWGKDTLGLDDAALNSEVWSSNKFFTDPKWTEKYNEAAVPETLRAAHGNDNKYGFDHLTPRFIKKLDPTLEEKITPGVGEIGFQGDPDDNDTGGGGGGGKDEIPGKLFEESLTPYDYARYFSDVATIVPEEYLQQTTPRYKPLNLLTAREQINEAARTAAAASLSGTGVESVDAARQAAVASSLAGQAGKATENVQNLNRGIVDEYFQYNNAQFLNAQQANERAKADFVQRSMQNQQAAQETRRQAQEDFAEKSRDVSQFNTGLRFAESTYSPQYSTFVGEDGKIPIVGRDGTEYRFSPNQLIFGNLTNYATPQTKTKSEKSKEEKSNRKGGKVKSKSRKLIK